MIAAHFPLTVKPILRGSTMASVEAIESPRRAAAARGRFLCLPEEAALAVLAVVPAAAIDGTGWGRRP